MKIQKLKIILFAIIFFICLSISTNVNAYFISVNLSSDSTKLEGQKTYKITGSISAMDVGNGINVISAKFNYDTSIFDKNATVISATNGWNPMYKESTGAILFERMEKTIEKDIFFTVYLKTKSVVSDQTTTISLTNIKASGGIIEYGGTGNIEATSDAIIILDKKNEDPKKQDQIITNDNNSTTTIDPNTEISSSANTNSNSSQQTNEQPGSNTNNNQNTQNTNTKNTITQNKNNSSNNEEQSGGNVGIWIGIAIVAIAIATAIIFYYVKNKEKVIYK